MPSDLLDNNAVETTTAQPRLRLVPPTKPTVPIVEDHDDSRDVRVIHPVILMDGSVPLIDNLKAIRRIQRNEAQSWGLARSRPARG